MSDYVVIRPGLGLPDGFLPPHLDGKWFDKADVPLGRAAPRGTYVAGGVSASEAVAVPTGRFEVRDDGAVAEVYEVRV